MKCLIIHDEISEEECTCIQAECYKKKNGRELPKKIKRIIGWNVICKNCEFHKALKKQYFSGDGSFIMKSVPMSRFLDGVKLYYKAICFCFVCYI